MTNVTKTTVRVHRVYINAPAQKVWEAITDPTWNGRYAFKAPSEYDLRPGGAYRVVSTPEMVSFGAPAVLIDGEVLECEAPTRLVQSWRAHSTPETTADGFTRLTWELEEDPPGMTRLTVIHDVENAPAVALATAGDDPIAQGGGGWAWILSDLKTFLETGSPAQV